MSTVTAVLMLAAVCLTGVVDIYATWSNQETVSQVISNWSREFPVLPLAVGLLMGHLFWPSFKPTMKV